MDWLNGPAYSLKDQQWTSSLPYQWRRQPEDEEGDRGTLYRARARPLSFRFTKVLQLCDGGRPPMQERRLLWFNDSLTTILALYI